MRTRTLLVRSGLSSNIARKYLTVSIKCIASTSSDLYKRFGFFNLVSTPGGNNYMINLLLCLKVSE